jgi:hypothetical protein
MANFESRCRHTDAYVGMSCQFLLLHLEHRPPTIYSKWPHRLLLAGLSVTSVKITVTGTPNQLNYYELFDEYTQFANVAAGRLIQTGEAHEA